MNKSSTKQKSKLSLKAGGYSLGLCAIVIAIVIVLNVLVGLLPEKITTPDFSSLQLYDFTEETIKYVDNLSDNITIYFWMDDSNNNSIYISNFLDRFKALNTNRIKVKTVSPDRDPQFIYNYCKEGEEPANNSLIIESNKRFKIISYSDMFSWSESALQQAYYYVYYYGYSVAEVQQMIPYDVFAAENAVVNGIDYVLTDKLPVAYLLKGHGETDLGSYATLYAKQSNYSIIPMIDDQSLETIDSVPDDATAVIISYPKNDISENEYNKLLAYLGRGGSVMLFTSYYYDASICPNLVKLCEANGLEKVDGLVLETSGYYSGYPYNIIANKVSHEITESLINDGAYVYTPMAHGIQKINSYRSSLEFSPLLVSSSGSYSKIISDSTSSYEKTDDDVPGSFMLGVLVTEPISENTTSRFFWFSSMMLEDDLVYQAPAGLTVFLNSLDFGTEHEDAISIRTITMTNSKLEMSTATGRAWMIVLVISLPILLLVIGFVVWFMRRGRK